mgnify:CR=1 FL=1
MTNLDTIAEVWEILRLHIDLNERKEAAETLVSYYSYPDNNTYPVTCPSGAYVSIKSY